MKIDKDLMESVYDRLREEEDLEYEMAGHLYNYVRNLEAELLRLQKAEHNTAYTKCSVELAKRFTLDAIEIGSILRKHFV